MVGISCILQQSPLQVMVVSRNENKERHQKIKWFRIGNERLTNNKEQMTPKNKKLITISNVNLYW
jgi:hypothetical protein